MVDPVDLLITALIVGGLIGLFVFIILVLLKKQWKNKE